MQTGVFSDAKVRDEKGAVAITPAVVCALWHRAAGIIVYGDAAWRLCDLDLKVEPSGNKILNRCCKAETTMSMKRRFDEDY
jgi:hypothetical protein